MRRVSHRSDQRNGPYWVSARSQRRGSELGDGEAGGVGRSGPLGGTQTSALPQCFSTWGAQVERGVPCCCFSDVTTHDKVRGWTHDGGPPLSRYHGPSQYQLQTATPRGGHRRLHFIEEETKAQRDPITCHGSHGQ